MSFNDFNFVSRTHCPHCKTVLILIDNDIVFFPLCEIMKKEKLSELETKREVYQESF